MGDGEEGLNKKKKKRELVLPSGGLRGLCEMRCVWGVSPGPRGQVVSTAQKSPTPLAPRVLAVSAEAEGLSEPWRLNIPSHL